MTYQTFAHVYDEVMDHEQYQLWVNFTKDSFNTYTSRNIQKVMELACGTGEVSTLLTEAGYQVTGVDLSSEMLDIANNFCFLEAYFSLAISNISLDKSTPVT